MNLLKPVLFFLVLLSAVACNNGSGKKSTFSDGHLPLLNVPGNFAITDTAIHVDEIEVHWSSADRADSYKLLYRSSSAPETVHEIPNVTSPHTLSSLTQGENFFITIQAINSVGRNRTNEVNIYLPSTVGTLSQLSFVTAPSNTSNTDSPLIIQPKVVAQDAQGVTIVGYTQLVTITGYSDASCSTPVIGAVVSNTKTAVLGEAQFALTKIINTNVVALKASDGTLATACLNSLTISPGAAVSLIFSQTIFPLTFTAGTILATQPVISAFDANSNLLTSNSISQISLEAKTGSGCTGVTLANGLGGSTDQILSAGVATFSGIYVKNASTQSIQASLGSLHTCSLDVTVASGSIFNATTTISATTNIKANGVATSTITISLKDAYGNVISGTTPTIAVTGTSNTLGACTAGDLNGQSTCSVSSTKSETKTVSITSPASLAATTTTIFVAGAAVIAQSSISLGTGIANNTAAISITITLKDIYANPIVGVTPSYELLNSRGTFTVVSACSSTNTSGVSTCTFKTWRAHERVVRITSPTGLTSVMSRSTLTCDLSSNFSALEGTGTSLSPYLVSTPQQLDQIRCSTMKIFKLANDIDLANYDWMTNFYGTGVGIDGNFKTISNLSIDLNISDYATAGSALTLASFLSSSSGWVGAYNVIKDITFLNSRVISSGANSLGNGGDAATVCGISVFKFDNVHVVNGLVQASDTVAGIAISLITLTNGAGTSPPAELINSSFQGTVSYITTSGAGAHYRWGVSGLLGSTSNGGANVMNNRFEGTLDTSLVPEGNYPVAGIIGRIDSSENNTSTDLKISNNVVVNSQMTSRGSYIGGIIGNFNVRVNARKVTFEKNSISNSSLTSLKTSLTHVGGMIGQLGQSSDALSYLNKEIIFQKNQVTSVSLHAANTTLARLGGLIGSASAVEILDNYASDVSMESTLNSTNRHLGGLVGSLADITVACTNVKTKASRNYASFTTTTWNGANTTVKGLVGRKISTGAFTFDLTTDDNYFNVTLSGLSEPVPYADNGLSTLNMQNTIFSGWNNTTIWNFQPNQYPLLR
jgi:hypothetical protein